MSQMQTFRQSQASVLLPAVPTHRRRGKQPFAGSVRGLPVRSEIPAEPLAPQPEVK